MTATYDCIATTTLSSASNTVTFSSIPNTYTDLILVGNGYSASGDGDAVRLSFNSDTATNYSRTYLAGTGTGASSGRNSNQSIIFVGNAVGWDTTSTEPAMFIAHLMNYSNTTTYKTVLIRDDAAAGTYPGTEANVGLYRSTSAISAIEIKLGVTSQFAIGSTFALYGVKAE